MKKLVVYDASCPMCRLYTKGMTSADSSGYLTRISNDELTDNTVLNRIDQQRARHEIPLVDLDGGETLYGVDTWIYAVSQRSNQIAKLLSQNWLRTVLQKLYGFISYNRRIIITSAPSRWQLLDLQPDFRLSYRLAFVLLVMGLVSGLHYAVDGPFEWPVFALLGGQLGLVSLYSWLTRRPEFRETLLDYCGHLGMSLLVGGLVMAISAYFNWPMGLLVGSGLAITQHFIRIYRLGLNPWLSASFTLLYLLIILS
ncbi:thiol-disulfide oxidoreductase DCC family protein [Spirosoma arcticum]